MNIITNKADLLKVLSATSRAVPSKPAVEILNCFLLNAEGGTLNVTASDGTLSISSSCKVNGDGGKFCLNAKTLLELTRTLPDGTVDITAEGQGCTISWGSGHSELPVFDAKDFPDIPEVTQEWGKVIKADELLTAIKHTLPCLSTDQIRPVMTGLNFNPTDDGFDIVGTDARILSVYPVKAEGNATASFVIPALAATALKDSLGSGDVEVYANDTAAKFIVGDTEIQTKTIVGKYPNYNSVIPTNQSRHLTGDISQLVSALKRVGICSNKASNLVKLTLNENECKIEAQDLSYGVKATETYNGSYEGEAMQIGFRQDLMAQALSVMTSETFKLSFMDSAHAGLLTGDGDPVRTILMPIRLQ